VPAPSDRVKVETASGLIEISWQGRDRLLAELNAREGFGLVVGDFEDAGASRPVRIPIGVMEEVTFAIARILIRELPAFQGSGLPELHYALQHEVHAAPTEFVTREQYEALNDSDRTEYLHRLHNAAVIPDGGERSISRLIEYWEHLNDLAEWVPPTVEYERPSRQRARDCSWACAEEILESDHQMLRERTLDLDESLHTELTAEVSKLAPILNRKRALDRKHGHPES
jgi:hypothetical protein